MTAGWFVTGTDTGVGKTLVSCALLHALRAHGRQAVGMKPVAAGCGRGPAGLLNQDVEALLAASAPGFTHADINSYAFEPPIAPHVAAAEAGVAIDFDRIQRQYQALVGRAGCVVVEGAGGWLVPLSASQTFADLARLLWLPVVLVVGMRLGCLNHALLTAESIERCGLPLAGWVANRIDPRMARFDENLAALRARIAAPLLGTIAFQMDPQPARVAGELSLP